MKQLKLHDIHIKVGETTEVKLRLHSGTAYDGVLAHKPDCLWLESVHRTPSHGPGSPYWKIFTFIGANKCQDYIQFDVVSPLKLDDVVQKVTYNITVSE
jgi:hypothetical protein